MDQGLFTKHIRTLQKRESDKVCIIEALLEKTGIKFKESEIEIAKKRITFSTSSVKKTAFIQKGGKDILTALGYSLRG